MILFVFEGERREPMLYRTLERLYFPRGNDNIVCSFGNDIYDLCGKMKELGGDGDIVSLLKELLERRGDRTLHGVRSSDVSQTYLFFDFDFHGRQLDVKEAESMVSDMLGMFDDETGNGRLYINYPMVESIRYVKELPDEDYWRYAVSREECRDFKRIADEFSSYGNLDFIMFKEGETPSKERYATVRGNWETLKRMNVNKANYVICGTEAAPKDVRDIAQDLIFEAQVEKYIDASGSVAVLNSFPLFLFEYFGK